MAQHTADATPAPDEERMFHLLRKTGLDANEALRLLLEIRNMSSANLIAQIGSELKLLRWMITTILALLAIFVGMAVTMMLQRSADRAAAPPAPAAAAAPAPEASPEIPQPLPGS